MGEITLADVQRVRSQLWAESEGAEPDWPERVIERVAALQMVLALRSAHSTYGGRAV